jgi:hypothetical protein
VHGLCMGTANCLECRGNSILVDNGDSDQGEQSAEIVIIQNEGMGSTTYNSSNKYMDWTKEDGLGIAGNTR